METATAAVAAAELFYRDGRPFTGTPRRTETGAPYTLTPQRCSRCGGAGGAEQWRHTGFTCFDCAGSGKGQDRADKLYTADKLAKLNASAAKREVKRHAAQLAKAEAAKLEADARRAAFEAEHGALLARCDALAADWDTTIADVLGRARDYAKLTEGQIALLVKFCDRQEQRARERVTCAWIGQVGERVELQVTAVREASYERAPFRSYGRYMETVWIVTMTDANGNQIVSKSPNFRPENGSTFTLRATVKEHSEYQGIKQTVVGRAKAPGVQA